METLALHEFHEGLGGRFASVNGAEVVADYGDPETEHAALGTSAGVLDFSFRSRLVLTGADRVRFLHGQVTNDVKGLRSGEGCYAALTTAKGRMQSDLFIYALPEELLLDFEPELTAAVSQRLEKYIVADDVQAVDVAPHYGLLTVQGPKAEAVVRALGLANDLPTKPLGFLKIVEATLGEIYLVNQARLATSGFDLFVPIAALAAVADKLIAAAKPIGGRACGWQAFEVARVEAGIPRFGVDMDDTNFPQECGIESRAVSYNKGCYIGQEVLNRIHTMGHVNKALLGLRLADELKSLPAKGEKLFAAGKEVGQITSAVMSSALKANLALAIVRNDANQVGAELGLGTAENQSLARIVGLPFGGV